MKKMIFCRYAALASLMIFVGLTASANVVWHNGETVTVAADIDDDIDLEGTVYVRVTGGTRSLTGVIREVPGKVGRLVILGPSKLQIRKQGVGPGLGAPPNEFSGGIELRDGTLSTYGSASSTGPVEAACPYGTGDVLVDNSDPSKKPMLDWMGSLVNNITVEASTSFDKPFLNRGGGTGTFGDVLIKGDGHVIAYTTRPDGTMSNSKMAINKSLTLRTEDGVKHDLYYNGSTIYNLQCVVVAHVMDAAQRFDANGNQICCSQYPGMIGGFWLGPSFKDSDVDLIRINQGWLVCAGDGVANGSFGVEFYGGLPTQLFLTKSYSSWEVGKEVDAGRFVLNYEGTKGTPKTQMWTQTIKWLDTDYRDDTEPNYIITRQKGTYPFQATLKFSGEPNRTAVAYMAIQDDIAITLDAPKTFTQIFSNRTHNITLPITVKGGTLEFSGCKFSQISTFAVQNGGTLRFRGGDMPALPTSLSIDGSLELIGEGPAPAMPDSIVISNGVFSLQGYDKVTNRVSTLSLVGEDATLRFPEGSILTVNSYIVDGVPQRDGDYLRDGVTIQARGGVFPPERTAIWVGKGADTFLTTAMNWEDGMAPDFDATLRVIFSRSGGQATVPRDTMIGELVFTNAEKIVGEGTNRFTLAGATDDPADTKLTVSGKILAEFDRSLVTLRNITIATPYGFDQGAPTRDGDKTFTLLTTNRNNAALSPLTIDNVVIEKPVYIRTAADGSNQAAFLMYVAEDSYNEFKGNVWKEEVNWATISLLSGSTLCFSGGFTSGYKWNVHIANDATFLIRDKPWTSSSSANRCVNIDGGHIIFDAVDNYFGYSATTNTYQEGLAVSASSTAGQMMTIDLLQNYALKRSRLRTLPNNASGLMFDFHNTTNGSRCLRSDNNPVTDTNETLRSYFTGEVGSMLHIDNEDRVHTTSYTYLHFRGGIGILKTGEGIFTLQRTNLRKSLGLNNDHASTGPLVVQQGTLKLDEGVTWRHCSAVDLSGGVLQVTEDLALGREATLNVTGGKISVPEGKTLWFASAVINGQAVNDGEYTRNGVNNPFKNYMTDDCKGTIRICQRGFLLIYK